VSSFRHDPAVDEAHLGELMTDVQRAELDQLQAAYKTAVEEWIAAIREEEALVSGVDHSVVNLDQWEAAGFREHKKRQNVIYQKRIYEDALRREFFGF
jgi:hypothetical protein